MAVRDRAHLRRHQARRPLSALVAEFVVLTAAGFLFATSAYTANGTQLRSYVPDAADRLQTEQMRHGQRAVRVEALQREVEQLTADVAGGNSTVAALQRRSAALVSAAGALPAQGPGLVVTLDDARRTGAVPVGARPDDLVVHQQDVQAVVNALWSGGAEAIQLMDQRVISTSAVRCVGNTLFLQGRVYSPPYRVTAIGDVSRLQRALTQSTPVQYYLQYVQAYGLGWSVVPTSSLVVPGYTGSVELRFARVTGRAQPPTQTPASTQTPAPAQTPAPTSTR